ncbi:hypothetical protein LR48_Vigan499s002100 [Vigna angularis]|uniref:MLO-like protein n=1 Tax=Phaseolus angularis TaxID=3914 RepID=A0A0L9TC34_PHAAN|nr:hypothetical protein LR48_Vigan499s002100 [Vigna angularis]
MGEENGEGRSLADTPTYAVATVITVLVSFSFLFQGTLKKLVKNQEKISAFCSGKDQRRIDAFWASVIADGSLDYFCGKDLQYSNRTVVKGQVNNGLRNYCPEGHESLASYESLEQLHRFVFVLGVTHVTYSFLAVALAMIKLCFSRQFWSSIHRADYMALRLGFITNHDLPTTYDFHNYMLRSMDEEFRDIVGVSVLLWVYAICCIFLNFHGSNFYFWLSFVPAIWEIKDPSCFMNNRTFIVIRLSFGVISQVWCSFITFPLYVIITQMGSRFKKTVVSENVRKSLSKWQRRVKERQSYSSALLTATSAASISSFISGNERGLISEEGSSSGTKDICLSYLDHVSRTQADASFPSYENDPHDIIHDSSPPLS